jgi:ankyrin repeat protein
VKRNSCILIYNLTLFGIYLMACRRHEETAMILLQRGADPNLKTDKKRTALHDAAYENLTQAVQMLIALGADVNAKVRS